MRFATISFGEDLKFVLSPDGAQDFYLWESFRERFRNEKLVAQVQTLNDFIDWSEHLLPFVESKKHIFSEISPASFRLEDCRLPFQPKSFRDFYAFEEHVKNGRKSRGMEMIPEWYEFPTFYYSNHLNIRGPNADILYPTGSTEVDFEMELGCVVGRRARNLSSENAGSAIFGYCLLNDFSARDFQRQEMKLNLGPSKGKDFGTSFGPIIYTAAELTNFKTGKNFDLRLEMKLNGEVLTASRSGKMFYSFEEMLVRASANCDIYPGELIASGTLGNGCFLELNLAGKKRWLKQGDELELGWNLDEWTLKNRIG